MTSPRFLARMTGLFFLLTILAGIFAQGFVSERLINFSDAAATANNILMQRGLFELGFTVYLIEMACQVTTAVLFYQLLKPVNRTVALLALFLEAPAASSRRSPASSISPRCSCWEPRRLWEHSVRNSCSPSRSFCLK